MKAVVVKDTDLQKAAGEGMDAFIQVFTDAIHHAIGGELNAENMQDLNADQITLLAYIALRDEVMDGGFVQLIHNGYGPFFFKNPFDRAMRNWGIHDLYKLINKCHRYYNIYHEEIEADCTQEEFDALYEQFPCFDDFDDTFVERRNSHRPWHTTLTSTSNNLHTSRNEQRATGNQEKKSCTNKK